MTNNSNFLETLDALDALYSDNSSKCKKPSRRLFTEALTLLESSELDKAHLQTTYKGYKIYRYSHHVNLPQRINGITISSHWEDRYFAEDENGNRIGIGTRSIDSCKEAVDTYIRETDYQAAHEKAKKLLDTTATTYRGCAIMYAHIQDAEKGLYSYKVMGDTRTADYVVSDISDKTYKSIDAAKKAIDECIREWNAYASESDEYKESFKRFIRESLAELDA